MAERNDIEESYRTYEFYFGLYDWSLSSYIPFGTILDRYDEYQRGNDGNSQLILEYISNKALVYNWEF